MFRRQTIESEKTPFSSAIQPVKFVSYMSKTIMVSYAGAFDPQLDASLRRAQSILAESAPVGGIDQVVGWDRQQLEATQFYLENRAILDQPRGGGYWLWKPYIILEALKSAKEDDIVVYWDVGKFKPNQFTRDIVPLVRWCRDHNGLLPGVPILPQGTWTKRDCFHFMGCDSAEYWNAKQIQATFSFWSGKAAIEFVSEWLRWCKDARCLTDDPNQCGLPNLQGFKEHRHDQSILTNLCVKNQIATPASPSIFPSYWTKNINLWADLLESRHITDSQVVLSQNQSPDDPTRIERTCRIILKYEPRNPFAMHRLGMAYLRLQRTSEAVEVLRLAAALLPNRLDFQRDLATALNVVGKYTDLLPILRQLVKQQSTNVQSHIALAQTLHTAGQLKDAVSEYEEAIRLDPKNVKAMNDLGLVCSELRNPDGAERNFRAALVLEPDTPKIHGNLGNVLSKQGRIDQAIDYYRRALELNPDSPGIHSNLLLAYNYQPRSNESLLTQHKEWAERHAARFYPAEEHKRANEASANGRLRVGYVSADFRKHSVASFIGPVLKAHNRDRFEVFCYSDVARPDQMTQLMQGNAEHWRDVARLSDDRVARVILDDKIDILVDLAGHMGRHRLLIFARRVAPLQVTYLGYPNTTGLATMDYRITDAEADPPGMTESHHTEKLIRLPTGFLCYQPPAETPPLRDSHRTDSSSVTFGCFNNLAKVTKQMIGVWAEILRRVPGSKLVLKAEGLASSQAQADVHAEFASHGVDASRIQLVGFMPSLGEHLAAYHGIDIALDTFPYHGTTTTCEALWMGVPVVTLAGKSHRSRVGVSILTRVGLSELIASTLQGYIENAVVLAADSSGRWQIAANLRGGMRRSQLMNGSGFVNTLEAAYLSFEL
jgi:protein O-GlcNAc transferase